jgi:flagellar basal-body rod protein FlgB
MDVTTGSADVLQRYLNLTSNQMKLTASNMANLDTPGYKTVGMDFASELNSQVTSGGEGAPVQAAEVDGLVARPDGNNVSMDRESMQLAQAQLQFRTGIELLRHQFTMINDAIHADGK